MKRKLLPVLLICVTYLFIASCHKNDGCYWAAEPFAPVFFQLYKNDQLVTDSSFLASMKLYYNNDNQKIYIPIQGINNANTNDTDIFYKNRVMSINVLSTLKVKEYYLEYPDSASWATDKLNIDYVSPAPETGCQYKLNKIVFNGSNPPGNTIYYQTVYALNKK